MTFLFSAYSRASKLTVWTNHGTTYVLLLSHCYCGSQKQPIKEKDFILFIYLFSVKTMILNAEMEDEG